MCICVKSHHLNPSISSPLVSGRQSEKAKRHVDARLTVTRGGLRTKAAKTGWCECVCLHVGVKMLKGLSHSISVYGLHNYITSVY